MTTLTRWTSPAILAGCVLAAGDAGAQSPHEREGFWFYAGLGHGSMGCPRCGAREGALSGGLGIGGTLGPNVMVGAGMTAWSESANGATLTVGTLTAVIRYYVSATAGFFLLSGVGLGSIHAALDGYGSETETGRGLIAGLGWDIRLSPNVSLTPFGNLFVASTTTADANVWQLGLGITVQ